MILVNLCKLAQIMNHKNKVVNGLTKGIEGLFRKNKVDYLKGVGSFKNQNTIHIKLNDGTEKVIKSKNTIIATGSEPNNLPGGILPIDENRIISSTGPYHIMKEL
jgi:dihydrolipoamide dehydrogenase